ncbi:MAG: hypothetical protein U0P81_15085 [Holophagaceae bacterium]
MSKRSLGSLADLAKILEESANPESVVREDRKVVKAKKADGRKAVQVKAKVVDPKRKAWHDRRLKEQAAAPAAAKAAAPAAENPVKPALTKAVATSLTGSLLDTLAAAKEAKPKQDGNGKKTEAWRRKPGDPIF